MPSPAFCRINALAPSHTTTQSPSPIFMLGTSKGGMLRPLDRNIDVLQRRDGDSVAAVQQPAGDDMRLDFGGALEDVEDARIAQYARHGVLQREAVPAMDLQ